MLEACDIAVGGGNANGHGEIDACKASPGALNGDGRVDAADLGVLLHFCGTANPPMGDLNGDSLVDGSDLAPLPSSRAP